MTENISCNVIVRVNITNNTKDIITLRSKVYLNFFGIHTFSQFQSFDINPGTADYLYTLIFSINIGSYQHSFDIGLIFDPLKNVIFNSATIKLVFNIIPLITISEFPLIRINENSFTSLTQTINIYHQEK